MFTIIGTVHMDIETDTGKYNADTLYNIIEKINPNIIFEETNYKDYVDTYIYNVKSNSVEKNTVLKYIKNYDSKNIPVDTLEQPCNFQEIYDAVNFCLKIPNNHNKELIDLVNQIDKISETNGIEGVNTDFFDSLINERHKLFIDYIHSHKVNLIDYYDQFIQYMCENRECRMVENIIKYKCLNIESRNSNVVFLIGAAHRVSMYNKLQNVVSNVCELISFPKLNGT